MESKLNISKDLNYTLKIVAKFDGFICIFASLILLTFKWRVYIPLYVLGVLVALINFTVSGIVIEKSMFKLSKMSGIFILLSYVIRILIIAGIAAWLCWVDKHFLMPYILGFISNFLALIYYATKIKNLNEKGSD